jgi:Concanavalin A-like lectin/glucanases superfamily
MKNALLLICLLFVFVPNLFAEKMITYSFDKKEIYKNWTGNGKFGGSLLFKGNKASIDKIPAFQFPSKQSFTIELWVKPTTQDTKAIQTILSQQQGKTSWKFYLYTRGRLGFTAKINGKRNINVLSPENSINQWTHLAFVRDCKEGTVRYYFNKKLLYEKKAPSTSEQFFIKQPVFIGCEPKGTNNFDGFVDEIKVSPYAKRKFIQGGQPVIYKPFPPECESPDPLIATSWDEIEKAKLALVPCPKIFRLERESLKINSKEWTVIFNDPQIKAGVDEINSKLIELGNKTIALNEKIKKNKIIVGTFKSLKNYIPKIGNPQKPKRQGYVIGFYKERGEQNCIIAGTDMAGARYGCITLSMMFRRKGKHIELTKARVSDWPDYKYRMGFKVYGNNIEYGKKIIDKAFRLKYNMMATDGFYRTLKSMFKTVRQRQILCKYAADRGIKIVVGGRFNVGLAPYPKNMTGYTKHYYPYKTEKGLIGNRGDAYTWSRDDLIDKKGNLVVKFMKETQTNSFFFHAMDCGARSNPENWNYRTPMDKKRWSNDRAGADANLINRIFKKMKQENPEVMMLAIVYPYGARYLKYPEIKSWLKRLSSLIPERIFLCVREDTRENMKKWKNSNRQGRFIYHEPFPWSLRLMFATTGRYAKTFLFDDKDIYWFCISKDFQYPAIGVAAEYCWNTEAPGWRWQPENHRAITQLDSIPAEISKRLLPRICEIFWGKKAAKNMSKVYLQNLSCAMSANMSQFTGADPLAYFKVKYEAAQKALNWINKAGKEIKPSSKTVYEPVKRFVFNARYLIEAKYRYYLSRELLADEKYTAAEKEIEQAKKALSNLPHSKYKKAVMKELDIAAAIKWHRIRNRNLKNEKRKEINIGVYSMNLGLYRGILDSFKRLPGIRISTFNDPTKTELKKFNVIIFPACKDMWDTAEDWQENVKEFVRNGGGVIFSHNAVGRIPSSAFGKPLFPKTCAGYDGQLVNKRILKASVAHPATGLQKGEKFEHEYNDHLFIKPGAKGLILLINELGKPVTIVGDYGKGRVIYTGQIFGLNRKNEQKESRGKEWKILLNMVRWSSEGL